ncbi:MAG: transporter, partial [Burkholderiaceae bacterium]|nr:transporter [Burkholderiaceae bacterium]
MQKIKNVPWPSLLALALGWSFAGSAALAQSDESPPVSTQFLTPAAFLASPLAQATGQPLTLKMLFERAWARQPEAQSTAFWRGAAQAELSGASSWTADPVALQLQTKTDRPGRNQGSREVEVGVAIPLWLPG